MVAVGCVDDHLGRAHRRRAGRTVPCRRRRPRHGGVLPRVARPRAAHHRCADCGHWHHPPRPMCPACWSWNVVPTPVSGQRHDLPPHPPAPGSARARASTTPRRRTRSPRSSSRSSPALRITSTVVGTPPHELAVGMPVELDVDRAQRRAVPGVRRRASGSLTTRARATPSRTRSRSSASGSTGFSRRQRSHRPRPRARGGDARRSATPASPRADIDGVVATGEPGGPVRTLVGSSLGLDHVTHFTRPAPVAMFSFVDAVNAVFSGACDPCSSCTRSCGCRGRRAGGERSVPPSLLQRRGMAALVAREHRARGGVRGVGEPIPLRVRRVRATRSPASRSTSARTRRRTRSPRSRRH